VVVIVGARWRFGTQIAIDHYALKNARGFNIEQRDCSGGEHILSANVGTLEHYQLGT
jgi:hypothetical protein